MVDSWRWISAVLPSSTSRSASGPLWSNSALRGRGGVGAAAKVGCVEDGRGGSPQLHQPLARLGISPHNSLEQRDVDFGAQELQQLHGVGGALDLRSGTACNRMSLQQAATMVR